MGVNSLPKTVTGRRRGCDRNPGPSAPESSTDVKKIFLFERFYIFGPPCAYVASLPRPA